MSDNATRNQYLKAMGIDVWVERETSQSAVTEDSQEQELADNPAFEQLASFDENTTNKPSRSVEADVSTLDWQQLEVVVNECRRCELLKSRTNSVFGSGHRQADLFIIGSMPNQDEDAQNQAFIGTEGVLLDNMLRTINSSRQDVFTTNLIKCNPQQQRQFSSTEMSNCVQFVHRQIALVEPKVILVFGEQSAQFILKTNKTMSSLTRQLHDYEYSDALVVVIEHPEQLLIAPAEKKQAWLSLVQINTILKK